MEGKHHQTQAYTQHNSDTRLVSLAVRLEAGILALSSIARTEVIAAKTININSAKSDAVAGLSPI